VAEPRGRGPIQPGVTLDARITGRPVPIRQAVALYGALRRAYGQNARVIVLVPRDAHEERVADDIARTLHYKGSIRG
jgi:hypothetical protein